MLPEVNPPGKLAVMVVPLPVKVIPPVPVQIYELAPPTAFTE